MFELSLHRNKSSMKRKQNKEKKEVNQYQEWLRVIANSRLIFNTLEELETYLDNHSIKDNGILRSYNTEQKARAAFYDLYMYCDRATESAADLEKTMLRYKKASEYYLKKLSRKKYPEKLAADLLSRYYSISEKEKYTKSTLSIFDDIKEKGLSVPLLVLLILKAWPSYESKDGDADDFAQKYNATIDFMSEFTKEIGFFETMPAIEMAKQELRKTRMTLLGHVKLILSKYIDFSSHDNIFDLTQNIKENLADLDIEGFWNECGGRAERTDFWHIESTKDIGIYFATKYEKKQDGTIEKKRFSMEVSHDDGKTLVYLVHPKAPKHLVNGQPYDEGDHCYYDMKDVKDSDTIDEMFLTKIINYKAWPCKINLTRVTDSNLINDYNSMLDNCRIVNKYAEWEYVLLSNLYAITREAIYIVTAEGDKFYKVPIDMEDSFSKITIDSNVGLLVMSNMTYIVFDECMLYIPVKKIKKYGIEVVERVE